MIKNPDNYDLEKFLATYYDEILKSTNKEKYMFDYTKFDLFYEINYNDEIVGFITLENNDSDENLMVNECYVKPEARGENLFFKTYSNIANNTEKQLFIRKPNKNLINVLLHNGLAFKMQGDVVISYVDFIVELKDTYKNSKIKHHYKKVNNENSCFTTNLFDLNLSATLFFDNNHVYSRKYDVLCVCEARKYDLKKYSIRKKLKKIQPKYLDETFESISNNLTDAFDFFKNLDENFSNSNKTKNRFLNEHPEFKDENFDRLSINHDFIINCPLCGELTQKSAIYCHNCGFNLEKTIIKSRKKYDLAPVGDVDDFEEYYIEKSNEFAHDNQIQQDFNELMNIFDDEEEMKDAFQSMLEATGELALVSRELHKEPSDSLKIIDYNLLGINRNNYDSNEEKKLNIEKSSYALVKYTNEHPTPWKFDYYLKSIDDNAFDRIIEKEYITKVMPDKYSELFENYSVEELIRESESYHDPDTTKEDMIEYFKEWSDYSWIVSRKGLEYLKMNPFLDFFTNNLMEFNIYEFKLFADKFNDTLSLEEIGDKYVNAKLTKALSNDDLDLYLDYVDYYFNLNLSKKEYDVALIYLIQRILYEINIWHLKEYHFAFDEALSIRTDYLLFKITKLSIDFDLESIYDEAYNSLKIEEIKFKYDDNYDHIKRLMDGESVYDISDELLDKSKEEGTFKSLFND